MLVAVGVSLLALAGGDALAELSLGGGGNDTLHGQSGKEALIGFGGDDELWGRAGDDTLHGGKGDDELYGGPGRDTLLAGSGDDFVETKDGQRDYVECGGGGHDEASVDARDRVTPDCETLFASSLSHRHATPQASQLIVHLPSTPGRRANTIHG